MAQTRLREGAVDRIRQLELRPWVWTIAMNLCRNAARTRNRRPRTVILDRDAFSPVPGPESRALDTDANAQWTELLGTLPVAQRTGVVLRHVVGLLCALSRPERTTPLCIYFQGFAALLILSQWRSSSF